MVDFIRGEMQRRVQDGFSILFPAADTVRIFGGNLKISHIAAVPQAHHRLYLILNLSSESNKGTPSFNDTANREVALESMQFGRAFPRIIQAIW